MIRGLGVGSVVLGEGITTLTHTPPVPNKDQIQHSSGLSGACLDLILGGGCMHCNQGRVVWWEQNESYGLV